MLKLDKALSEWDRTGLEYTRWKYTRKEVTEKNMKLEKQETL